MYYIHQLALKSLAYLTSNNAYMCEEAYLTTSDAYMCHETFSFMLLLPAMSLEQQKGWDGGGTSITSTNTLITFRGSVLVPRIVGTVTRRIFF